MMGSVPNKPKTPLRNVRVDDQLWVDAQKVAAEQDTNVSEVIRQALLVYILEHDTIPYTKTTLAD